MRMARWPAPELGQACRSSELKMVTIKALIEYRMHRETFVRRAASASADDVRRL